MGTESFWAGGFSTIIAICAAIVAYYRSVDKAKELNELQSTIVKLNERIALLEADIVKLCNTIRKKDAKIAKLPLKNTPRGK